MGIRIVSLYLIGGLVSNAPLFGAVELQMLNQFGLRSPTVFAQSGNHMVMSLSQAPSNKDLRTFQRQPDGSWTLNGLLPRPTRFGTPVAVHETFGSSLAMSGSLLAVGTSAATVDSREYAGLVEMYERQNGNWSHIGVVASSNQQLSFFGTKVLLQGNQLLVRASKKISETKTLSVVIVHERHGNFWTAVQTLICPSPELSPGFGAAMTLNEDWLVISSPGVETLAGNTRRGEVYLYRRTATKWVLQSRLRIPKTPSTGLIGQHLSIHGNRIVMSGFDKHKGNPNAYPRADVFVEAGGKWRHEQTLRLRAQPLSSLPKLCVGIHENLVLLGEFSRGVGLPANLTAFFRVGGQWQEVTPPLLDNQSGFSEIQFTADQVFALNQSQLRVFTYTRTPELAVYSGKKTLSPRLHHGDNLAVGETIPGATATASLLIHNKGHLGLGPITSEFIGEGFSVDPLPQLLLPGQQVEVKVRFQPTEAREFFGTLKISAQNDPLTPNFDLALSARATTAVEAPQVAFITPSSLLFLGETVRLQSEATGTAPLRYQWLRNGKPIRGATEETFLLTEVQLRQAGKYVLEVRNAHGKIRSNPVPVAVVEEAAGTFDLNQGRTISLAVKAAGPGLQWQWHKEGQALSDMRGKLTGAVTSTVRVAALTTDDAGLYTLTAKLAAETLASAGAFELNVLMRPEVQAIPPASWLVGLPVAIPLLNMQDGPANFSGKGFPPGVTTTWMPTIQIPTYDSKLAGIPTRPGNYTIQLRGKNRAGTGPSFRLPVVVRSLGSLVGQYTGSRETLEDNPGGPLRFAISRSGGLSGQVWVDGKMLRFRNQGLWSADPATDSRAYFGGVIFLPETNQWSVDLRVNPQTHLVTGSLLRNSQVRSTLKAVRVEWPNGQNPPPAQGQFTVALTPPSTGDPLGAAHGQFSINGKGRVRWSGRAGDGSPLTLASAMGTDLSIPVSWPLYRGRGHLQGWLQVSANGINEVTGAASWSKQEVALPPRSYRFGFAKMDLEVIGARYQAPLAGGLFSNLAGNPGAATLSIDFPETHFFDGVPDLTMPMDVSNAKRVRPLSSSTRQVAFNFSRKTGLITGHWMEGVRKGRFSGVLIPGLGLAIGHGLLAVDDSPQKSAAIVSGRLQLEPFEGN